MSLHRLLIVDDMPVIVDGLSELFSDRTTLELEVFKAYSVFDALAVLERVKIDIVLSDIKMPVKTGLDLLKDIRTQWPRCKVIFLTSYHDFDYAREALANGVFDFVMKTEGDARIVAAVNQAVQAIEAEGEAEAMIERARQQFQAAKPHLQNEYFTELLTGHHNAAQSRAAQFGRLGIALSPDEPVFLLLCRLDEWKEVMNYSDRILLRYGVRNIMEEFMHNEVELASIDYDPSRIAWFLQPKAGSALGDKEIGRFFRFVYGTMETVQNTCSSLLKLKVSFIIRSTMDAWADVPKAFQQLESLFRNGLGLTAELLTTDEELLRNGETNAEARPASLADRPAAARLQLHQYARLPDYLSNSRQDEFYELFDQLNRELSQEPEHPASKLEAYHYLSYMFASQLNRSSARPEAPPVPAYAELAKPFDGRVRWQTYADDFKQLADRLFRSQENEKEEQTNRVVSKLQQFISDNLSGDISLTRLSSHVYLNPSYLSRLYKQMTGIGLSEYITNLRIQTAKEMLENDELRIHEIAEAVGYQSGIAFTRFFKKVMNMTPQEYRDINRKP